MLNLGIVLVNRTASSNAGPLAISVEEVTTPAGMRVDNGAIHSRSEAKIICIDNQPPHAASLAGRWRLESGAVIIGALKLSAEI